MTDSLIESENNFSRVLLSWYEKNKRPLPWRQNPSPYRVWLSEIILQQTRVNQGMPYYFSFIEQFPTVHDLAEASEDEVMRLWQGLGYYSRARNLHKTARYVSHSLEGKFPNSYAGLITLKGVGPYTAAAIASICFGEQVPVIDGNVFRFIARVFGIYDNIAEPKTRKIFEKVLDKIIPHDLPGSFNQAMMEMGALICTPGFPKCDWCEVRDFCYAYHNKEQANLPVKIKTQKVRNRYFNYHIWLFEDRIAMKKRPPGDIWQGLYDFDLAEEEETGEVKEPEMTYRTRSVSDRITHVLSHQKIEATFFVHEMSGESDFQKLLEKKQLTAYSKDEVVTLPKPKLIVNYLNQLTF